MSYERSSNQRIEALSELRSVIETLDLRNDEEFRVVFRDAQTLLELSDQELADTLSMSRPTVNRWRNGRNLPHFAMRKHILRWIGEQLTAKVKKIAAANREVAVASSSDSSYFSGGRAVPLAAKSR
jgi:transcriptional regulator with XRE-family HTH domain